MVKNVLNTLRKTYGIFNYILYIPEMRTIFMAIST